MSTKFIDNNQHPARLRKAPRRYAGSQLSNSVRGVSAAPPAGERVRGMAPPPLTEIREIAARDCFAGLSKNRRGADLCLVAESARASWWENQAPSRLRLRARSARPIFNAFQKNMNPRSPHLRHRTGYLKRRKRERSLRLNPDNLNFAEPQRPHFMPIGTSGPRKRCRSGRTGELRKIGQGIRRRHRKPSTGGGRPR